MLRGPHSQAGQNTSVSNDFVNPGGTFINNLVMYPSVTAWRCSAMAEIAHPLIKGMAGSTTGHIYSTNSIRLPSHRSRCLTLAIAATALRKYGVGIILTM